MLRIRAEIYFRLFKSLTKIGWNPQRWIHTARENIAYIAHPSRRECLGFSTYDSSFCELRLHRNPMPECLVHIEDLRLAPWNARHRAGSSESRSAAGSRASVCA
jgi:hypothetical protein